MFIFKNPSSKIVFRYCSIALIIFAIAAFLLPTLLNYAPGSINSDFDVEMSYISYTEQFAIIIFLALLVISLFTKFLLREIDTWYNLPDQDKYTDLKRILKVRKKCFDLPYTFFLFEIILPIFVVTLILLITGSHYWIMIVKILLITITFSSILAVTTYIFSKDLYSGILANTYRENINIGVRVNLIYKIMMQILPVCISVILFTSLIAYSRCVKEKEDVHFTIYSTLLNSHYSEANFNSTQEDLAEILNSIPLYDANDTKFIITPTGTVLTLNGMEPSNFVIQYTTQLASKYNGKTYDSYGIDTQGAVISIETVDGLYQIGVLYNISSTETLGFLTLNRCLLNCFINCYFIFFC